MRIGIPVESQAGEIRVAATPETVKKLVGLGHNVTVARGAGVQAVIVDSAYESAGVVIGSGSDAFKSEVVLKVLAANDSELALIQANAV